MASKPAKRSLRLGRASGVLAALALTCCVGAAFYQKTATIDPTWANWPLHTLKEDIVRAQSPSASKPEFATGESSKSDTVTADQPSSVPPLWSDSAGAPKQPERKPVEKGRAPLGAPTQEPNGFSRPSQAKTLSAPHQSEESAVDPFSDPRQAVEAAQQPSARKFVKQAGGQRSAAPGQIEQVAFEEMDIGQLPNVELEPSDTKPQSAPAPFHIETEIQSFPARQEALPESRMSLPAQQFGGGDFNPTSSQGGNIQDRRFEQSQSPTVSDSFSSPAEMPIQRRQDAPVSQPIMGVPEQQPIPSSRPVQSTPPQEFQARPQFQELAQPTSNLGGAEPAYGSNSNNPLNRAMPSTTAEAADDVYQVQPGDNYWTISRQFYGSARFFSSLAEYNRHRIPDPAKMKPGMYVLVPSMETLHQRYPQLTGGGPRDASSKLPPGFFVDATGNPAYRVGQGDTLSDIAQNYLGRSSRWVQIYHLNKENIVDGKILKVGSVLRLPPDAAQSAVIQTGYEQ